MRSRTRPTNVAAASDVPPRAKKSASLSVTAVPRTSTHSCASQSSVGVKPSACTFVPGRGQGNAFLSTFPEVVTGNSSRTHRRGMSARGMRSASCAVAMFSKSGCGVSSVRYATRILSPPGVSRTTTVAECTPVSPETAASTSPSSMRRPPIFT